jgi:hypothetical protein
MPERRINFLTNLNFIFWLYIIISIAASIHGYLLGIEHYGNYLIFKNSFYNLTHGRDLYALYPEWNLDLFKYSPTFSVLFAPFSFIPDYAGVVIWNLMNSMVLFFAIKSLAIDDRKKSFILWFILIELITSLQNFQSNGLIAGLMIFTFIFLEKKKYLVAGVFAGVVFYIKLFGILIGLLWFLFEGKARVAVSVIISLFILFLLPLLFVSPQELKTIYQSWFHLLSTDTPHELNHSVMSILKNWFSLDVNKVFVQIAGLLLLAAPLVKQKYFSEKHFQFLFLSSILIWTIIFNHKAESATYIIAVTGCAIWFFNSEKSTQNIILVIILFLLTILSPTDLFPKTIRENYIVPYSLKALPCILIWVKIQYELLSYKGVREN